MQNVYKVWDWIDKNVSPEKGRVVYQDTFGNMDDPILGRSDVFELSGVFTKVSQIGVSRPASPFPQEKFMRTDQGRIFGKDMKQASDSFIRDMMVYFNAPYIVTVEPELENKLKNSGLFFQKRKFGNFTIFRLKNFTGTWIKFLKKARTKKLDLDNQWVKVALLNRAPDNEIFIRIAYHPFWRARLNEKLVKIGQDKYGLMKIPIPETGPAILELSFSSFNPFWISVSFLSLITVIMVASRNE